MKQAETGSSDGSRLEDAMRGFHIYLPHFRHFSAQSVFLSAHEKLSNHSIEIAVGLTVLFGALMALTFWAVLAR